MKFWHRTSIIVAIGLTGLAGVGVGSFFLFSNLGESQSLTSSAPKRVNGASNFLTSARTSVTINELSGLKLTEIEATYPMHNQTFNYLLGSEGLRILKDKIVTRLNYGPESSILKSITIWSNPYDQSANGTYYEVSNEIYINVSNIFNDYLALGWNSSDGQPNYELLAESIFQVVYHEYHHHLAYVYLKSNLPDQNASNVQEIYIKRDNGTLESIDNWDKSFYDAFYQNLDYSNEQLTNFNASYFADGKTVWPLSNILSSKTLFQRANLIKEAVTYPELAIGSYAPFEKSSVVLQNQIQPFHYPLVNWFPYTSGQLAYYWGMDELFVRKMQQATMTIIDQGEFGYQNDGNALTGLILPNDPKPGKPLYLNSLFVEDLTRYTSDVTTLPYASDYLFKANRNDPDYDLRVRNLYQAFINRMGYSSKSDIALTWWRNDAKVSFNSSGNATVSLPHANYDLKFGGYIGEALSTKKFVGYFDDNCIFKSYAIDILPFHYQYKSSLAAKMSDPLKATNDNWTYITKDYIDVRTIANKNLFLADNETGRNATLLSSFNPEATTYYSSNSSGLKSRLAYLVNNKGAAQFTWEEAPTKHV